MDEPRGRFRRRQAAAATTTDPIDIALTAEASGKPPSAEASGLLQRQAVLIDEQVGLARNERFRNRIRAVRDAALAAVTVALLVMIGAAVWSASRADGLVLQPFSVPPELAEDGFDGRAVAALFQDELVRMQAATDSARPPASFRNDWSGAITVEVEAGGLSLTNAYRALTRWLGKETYLDGGLTRTPTGLSLVVRTSDGVALTVQGPADRPQDLMRQAAERFFEQTQPYRYAIFVGNRAADLPPGPERQAMLDRRREILTSLLSSPSETERIWAHNGLAVSAETTPQDGIQILDAGLEIDPDHPNLLLNLVDALAVLGRGEAALGVERRLLASLSNPRHRAKVAPDRQESYPLLVQARLAEAEGDGLRAVDLYSRLARLGGAGDQGFRRSRLAALIGLHQPSAFLRQLDLDRRLARSVPKPTPGNQVYSFQAAAAASLDQWPQAVSALEAFEAEISPLLSPRFSELRRTYLWPRLAYARARAGDLAGARTLIAATPLDCDLCLRERARIAELSGDRAGADRWSAEARRRAPSLPLAFSERGEMLLARGDAAGAIAFFEQAVRRGPRWADPQKFWGDALMTRGDVKGAISKYRAAADRAPNWGALHLAWGRALEAQGRRDQAREKYARADRLDLSAADRAEVTRRLAAGPEGDAGQARR